MAKAAFARDQSNSIKLESLANELSIGQKQLLTLAYSLLHEECHIVLLDEPTAQVDSVSQRQVLDNLFSMAN